MKKIELKDTELEQLTRDGSVLLVRPLVPQPPRGVYREGPDLWGTIEDEHGGSHGPWRHPIGPKETELVLAYTLEGQALLVTEEVLAANADWPVEQAKQVVLAMTRVEKRQEIYYWCDRLVLKGKIDETD